MLTKAVEILRMRESCGTLARILCCCREMQHRGRLDCGVYHVRVQLHGLMSEQDDEPCVRNNSAEVLDRPFERLFPCRLTTELVAATALMATTCLTSLFSA